MSTTSSVTSCKTLQEIVVTTISCKTLQDNADSTEVDSGSRIRFVMPTISLPPLFPPTSAAGKKRLLSE